MRPAQNSSELSDKENVSFIDDFADMAESVPYSNG
jgi:hypothetical protein